MRVSRRLVSAGLGGGLWRWCCPSIHSRGRTPFHRVSLVLQTRWAAWVVSRAAEMREHSSRMSRGTSPWARHSLLGRSAQWRPPLRGAFLSARASSFFHVAWSPRQEYQCVESSSARWQIPHVFGRLSSAVKYWWATLTVGSQCPRVLKTKTLSVAGSLCAVCVSWLGGYHSPALLLDARASIQCSVNLCRIVSVKSASTQLLPIETVNSS